MFGILVGRPAAGNTRVIGDRIERLRAQSGLSARLDQLQRAALCDGAEIPVLGQHGETITNCQAGDQAIDGGADGHARGTADTINPRSLLVIGQGGFRHGIECQEQIGDA